jgi:hypothetical protein
MNSDNILMIVGKRTCIVFDGDFDSLLRVFKSFFYIRFITHITNTYSFIK